MARRKHFAVTMGDLVQSSEVADRHGLHAQFNRRVEEANERFADRLASPLTITLGDEFQGLAETIETAFAVGHCVRVSLLQDGLYTRIDAGDVRLDT